MITRLASAGIIGAVLAVTLLASPLVAAEQTSVSPIDSEIGVQVTTIPMEIPADNTLPWAFVEGTIANHAPGYPVIIQIYDADGDVSYNDSGAVHFAQTDVDENGSYEYRFRVSGIEDGQRINLFEGDYIVKIFKVVSLDQSLTQA